MRVQHIFGKPSWYQDEQHVSHTRYNILQGLEYVVTFLLDRVGALGGMRLMLVPVEKPLGRRNRMQWLLRSMRVGSDYDYESGEEVGGFVVQVQINDFGSVREPGIWSAITHAIDFAIPSRERLLMLACYTPEGYYIGDLNTAGWLYFHHGLTQVMPLRVALDARKAAQAIREKWACQVGFDAANNRWVGWSHRAISGFPVGHVVEEGECVTTTGWTDEYIANHPEDDLRVPVGFEIKNLGDSLRCAIAFAESVG